MSKIKNGGLDQYGANPLNSGNFKQLALKGLSNILAHCLSRLWTVDNAILVQKH